MDIAARMECSEDLAILDTRGIAVYQDILVQAVTLGFPATAVLAATAE